jgi:protein-tyrosine phosphatase
MSHRLKGTEYFISKSNSGGSRSMVASSSALGSDSMTHRKHKTILFLCTGNYYRSRFAESLFNSVAGKMGLAWRASSRGLALELGVNNVGSMAVAAIAALKKMGIVAEYDCARPPMKASVADLEQADRIVALKQAEHQPLLQDRFPAWVEKTEYWHVDDEPEALALIEREIMGLVARILGGGNRPEAPAPELPSAPAGNVTAKPGTKPITAKVGRETAGRRGKGVTTVFDLPLGETGLQELAATLKQRCGTGGTVKNGRIEIQGDQRERIVAELEELGYRVKRAGG